MRKGIRNICIHTGNENTIDLAGGRKQKQKQKYWKIY